MVLMTDWRFALALAVAIALITLITDYIFIGSVSAAAVFPAYVAYSLGWTAFAIVCIASLAVILKHKENVIRLKNGTEVGFRRANSGKVRVK